ncbi:serine kinase of HPr protein (carbohydrate metabolism regulator) [Angulomicrobium tetraedrale]|uniref:Serine kinase of HPr protein (Carbohydrate metabolism regulator) n=1 Tax=Ancylobacter tetraedralis TaxID=217068 RepID=A0A839ZEN1_9HYPH|nr:HPr kinase/phosphatase C-terminal domain-containing protein [Ancylobacter tetraedralis]MBB3773219.1 serine kinase of HPr protein (carbohydrate metabolism regulator) [Ancylobacter tetraedralis]
MSAPTVHASCVSVGGRGVLLRGASGAGKSHLAFALILAGGAGRVPPVRLVADDRVRLETRAGGLVASAPHGLAGLLEVRGAGLRRLPFEAETVLDLVVDLDAPDAARLPEEAACRTRIDGVELRRLPVLKGGDPLQQVLAVLLTAPFSDMPIP